MNKILKTSLKFAKHPYRTFVAIRRAKNIQQIRQRKQRDALLAVLAPVANAFEENSKCEAIGFLDF